MPRCRKIETVFLNGAAVKAAAPFELLPWSKSQLLVG
jgi:hypothetical protein